MSQDLVDWMLTTARLAGSSVLSLFEGPVVTLGDGRRLEVPEGSKRLLVFVALHQGRVERKHAAGALWPIGDDERAAGNLRSALWRLNRKDIDVLDSDQRSLALRRGVLVDVQVICEWASRLINGRATAADLTFLPSGINALELLPGWYDDWVLMEREHVRQRLLHALEALSREHMHARRCAQAIEAAMVAVNAEPLRESAQRVLVAAHLAEGNRAEARRVFDSYCDLLQRELNVEPGAEIRMLMDFSHRPTAKPTLIKTPRPEHAQARRSDRRLAPEHSDESAIDGVVV